MFEYSLFLSLAKSGNEIDLTEPKFQKMLQDAAEQYAKRSNGKTIDIIKDSIQPRSFGIVLKSACNLDTPGRSLRAFSAALLEHSEFQQMVINHKLFLTQPYVEPAPGIIDPDSISDFDFIDGILKILLDRSGSNSVSNKHKRDVLNKIKIISKQEGLI